jgi:hypothetical protein
MKEIGFNKFKNRKKKKKRLSTKFLTVFFIPFFFGTLISTIVVIVYINIADEKLINNIKVQQTFENSKDKSSIPIILNAKFFIFDYFQKYINNLIKIREYYLSFNEPNLPKKIIYETFFNAINKTEIDRFKQLYNQNKEYKFNFAKWFINKEKKYINFNDTDNDSIILEKQLSYFSYILPLLKTIIDVSEEKSLIYFLSTSNNLIIKYPIEEKYIDGSDFNMLSNEVNCLNSNGNIIDYYFYKCRPYYISMKISKELGYDFTISDVYEFIDGHFGITICIQFESFLLENNTNIIICQDLIINKLIKILNNFNSKLDGYFFITKINSNIPIYYPFVFDIEEYNEISKMEFTLNNKYYSDEINKYNENLSNLTQIFKENKNITFKKYKNGQLYKYTVSPIFFNYYNDSNFNQYHFLSIVYVRPKIIPIKQYQDRKIKNVFISILFTIMAFIQLLLTKYFISSLAKKIIKPIKLIKKLLETDFEITTDNSNNNNNNIINNYNNNYLKKNISLTKDNFINENSPLLNYSNISFKTNENEMSIITNYTSLNNNFFSKEKDNDENNSLSSSSSDDDDDDENNKYESNNIQKLFVKFIDLKNSFKSFDDQSTNENLPYLVHAQNVFNNINNIDAFSICQSNISTFFIKNNEFDKAISHLNEGIRNIRIKILNFNNINELKRQIKTEHLTNRYLKLFYCYKSYFKYIKKMNKKNPNQLINSNFYIEHHIEKYKKNINEYLELINKINDENDLCIALLEKVEEIIQFEIIPSKNNFHDELSKKQNQIKNILELFRQIDKLNDNKITQNYNIIHLINILKYEPEIVNAMDIPPSILIQRTNYLKGKFYLKCSHYKKAIFFFENSLIYNKVGNISIIISSIKKLIKISKIYLTLVNNDIEIHKNESKYKYELRDDKQRKKILFNNINNLKQ